MKIKTRNSPTARPRRSGKATAVRDARPARADEDAAVAADVPLARARKVLEVLFDATRPLSALEIAKRCDLDPSSSHRLVQNLAACGYLLRDEASKRYLPHPRMLFPFPIYHPWELVRRDGAALVMPLRDRLSLTTGLVIYYLGARVLLELAPGRDALSPSYRTVLSSPLHASGSGKIFLMKHNEEERRRILGPEPFEKFTSATIQDYRTLNLDLARGAQQGYVRAIDDYMSGFRVVAAPISVSDHIVGALFCSGGVSSLTDERIADVGEEVRRSATLFSMATPNLRLLAELVGVGMG